MTKPEHSVDNMMRIVNIETPLVQLDDLRAAWRNKRFNDLFVDQELFYEAWDNRFGDGGGAWDEDPAYPLTDWQAQVVNDDTRLGYKAWVERCKNPDQDGGWA